MSTSKDLVEKLLGSLVALEQVVQGQFLTDDERILYSAGVESAAVRTIQHSATLFHAVLSFYTPKHPMRIFILDVLDMAAVTLAKAIDQCVDRDWKHCIVRQLLEKIGYWLDEPHLDLRSIPHEEKRESSDTTSTAANRWIPRVTVQDIVLKPEDSHPASISSSTVLNSFSSSNHPASSSPQSTHVARDLCAASEPAFFLLFATSWSLAWGHSVLQQKLLQLRLSWGEEDSDKRIMDPRKYRTLFFLLPSPATTTEEPSRKEALSVIRTVLNSKDYSEAQDTNQMVLAEYGALLHTCRKTLTAFVHTLGMNQHVTCLQYLQGMQRLRRVTLFITSVSEVTSRNPLHPLSYSDTYLPDAMQFVPNELEHFSLICGTPHMISGRFLDKSSFKQLQQIHLYRVRFPVNGKYGLPATIQQVKLVQCMDVDLRQWSNVFLAREIRVSDITTVDDMGDLTTVKLRESLEFDAVALESKYQEMTAIHEHEGEGESKSDSTVTTAVTTVAPAVLRSKALAKQTLHDDIKRVRTLVYDAQDNGPYQPKGKQKQAGLVLMLQTFGVNIQHLHLGFCVAPLVQLAILDMPFLKSLDLSETDVGLCHYHCVRPTNSTLSNDRYHTAAFREVLEEAVVPVTFFLSHAVTLSRFVGDRDKMGEELRAQVDHSGWKAFTALKRLTLVQEWGQRVLSTIEVAEMMEVLRRDGGGLEYLEIQEEGYSSATETHPVNLIVRKEDATNFVRWSAKGALHRNWEIARTATTHETLYPSERSSVCFKHVRK